MGKIRTFTRSILGFYFGSLWPALRGTWKWTAPTATALGLAIPLYLHFAKLTPAGEAAMTSLIWQIPVALFGSLLLMLVIYTPFSKYQALEREAVAKDDEIKRLKKARDKDAETLAQQIQQTKNMEGFWTERKAEVGLLTTERDLLKSQLASVSHSGRKLLNTEGMAALLALAEEWNKLHDAFLHRGVTDQAEIQLKDLTDRTEVFLKRELDDSHAAMVKNVPPEYPDLHGRQPREKHFVGLAAARLKKVNQIIEEQRRAH